MLHTIQVYKVQSTEYGTRFIGLCCMKNTMFINDSPGSVQEYYEAAVGVVSDSVNEWLASVDVDFQVQFLDECLATVELVELLKDPETTGQY